MFSLRAGLFLLLASAFAIPVVAQQRDQKSKKPSNTKPVMSKEAEELRLSATSLLSQQLLRKAIRQELRR